MGDKWKDRVVDYLINHPILNVILKEKAERR